MRRKIRMEIEERAKFKAQLKEKEHL